MLVAVAVEDSIEEVEVPEQEILHFPRGLVGFEDLNRYALFQLDGGLCLLQSVDDAHVGFVLLDPETVVPNYSPSLPVDDRALLVLEAGQEPEYLCIVTLSMEGSPSSINLRAPIAINTRRRIGSQVILQDMELPLRYPIAVSDDALAVPGQPPSSSKARPRGGAEMPAGGKGRAGC